MINRFQNRHYLGKKICLEYVLHFEGGKKMLDEGHIAVTNGHSAFDNCSADLEVHTWQNYNKVFVDDGGVAFGAGCCEIEILLLENFEFLTSAASVLQGCHLA